MYVYMEEKARIKQICQAAELKLLRNVMEHETGLKQQRHTGEV
jgi:hypothetical protein